ncbi:MAG: hypothetical protein PHH82_04110 [Candidatus ainarchaeum sp.]|nr:hypothetical protein [Candidatus ainarchaeum sp.]
MVDYKFEENSNDFSNYGLGEDEPQKPKTDYMGIFKKYYKYLVVVVILCVVIYLGYYLFFANRAEVSFSVTNFADTSQYSSIIIYKDNKVYETVGVGDLIKLKYGEYQVELDGLKENAYLPVYQKIITVDEYSAGQTYSIYVYPDWVGKISSFSATIPETVYIGGNLEITVKIDYSDAEKAITILGSGDLKDRVEEIVSLKKGMNEFKINVELPSDKTSFSGGIYIDGVSDKDTKYGKKFTGVTLKKAPNVNIPNLKSFGSISAGTSKEIDLVIKNQSNETIKDVQVSLESIDTAGDLTVDTVKDWIVFPQKFDIEPQKQATKKITLNLPIDASNTKITFNFKISNNFLNKTAVSDVEVKQADIAFEDSMDLGTIMAGQTKNQLITVKNNTNYGITLTLAVDSSTAINNANSESWVSLIDKQKDIAGNDETSFAVEIKPILTAKNDNIELVLTLSNNFFSKEIKMNYKLEEIDFGFNIGLAEKFTLQKYTEDYVEKFKKINDFVSLNNTGSIGFTIDTLYTNVECKKFMTITLPTDKVVPSKAEIKYPIAVSSINLNIPEATPCYMYVDYINPLTGIKDTKSKAFIVERSS